MARLHHGERFADHLISAGPHVGFACMGQQGRHSECGRAPHPLLGAPESGHHDTERSRRHLPNERQAAQEGLPFKAAKILPAGEAVEVHWPIQRVGSSTESFTRIRSVEVLLAASAIFCNFYNPSAG